MTLTRPAHVAEGSTWDSAVFFTGLDGASIQKAYGMPDTCGVPYDHANLLWPAGTYIQAGGLMARSGPAGADIWVSSSLAVADCKALPTRNQLGVPGRLIAVGIEVTNTTSDLYKQGSVSVAMVNAQPTRGSTNFYHDLNVAPVPIAAIPAVLQASMPGGVGEVRTIPGSATWAAEKGVYMIPRLANYDLEVGSGAADINRSWTIQGTKTVSNYRFLRPFPDRMTPASDFEMSMPQCIHQGMSSFLPTVAYFTGLSSQTTLQIVMRTVVEYFPHPSDALNSFAHPSPLYDPVALVQYAGAIRTAPYAVPVGFNPAGEYFRMVMKALAGAASAAAPFIPHPIGKLAMTGGAALVNQIVDKLEKREKKKKEGADHKANRVQLEQAGAKAHATRR